MAHSFLYVLICLLAGIALIVLLTAKYRVHPFFALILSCFLVGLGAGFPVADVILSIKEGFGNIMKSLGLIIVLGTTLGVLLEHTGSTIVMASFILKKTGEKYSALAMSITGFIVGLPIFCDSGFIVLSGLNNSLAKRTGVPAIIMSVSLATGLYAVHCLIPPHPGAAAAAGIIGVDIGKMILIGISVAIPPAMVGYYWAKYAGRKFTASAPKEDITIPSEQTPLSQPSVIKAFLPVIGPILLIGLKSFLVLDGVEGWINNLLALGDPVIALSIGILLALNCKRGWNKSSLSKLLQDAADKAGAILVIICAGGAFGAVLAATRISEQFSQVLPLEALGLLFPFLVSFVLKTAQGSSTVAIITAASIVQPLLPALGLSTAKGQILCVLSMGAGSMMISHANDAYLWVIAKFSGLEMNPMLKVYSVATLLMGLTTLLVVYILSLLLL